MTTSELLPHSGEARTRAERDIEDAGLRLPLVYRADAAAAHDLSGTRLLVVRDAGGRPCGALGLLERAAPIPGHRLVHVPFTGLALADDGVDDALEALVRLVRADRRVLRLTATLFETEPTRLARLREAMRARGFVVAALQNAYVRTLRLDLAPDEAALLAGIHASARRNIRELDKRPVRLAPIADPRLAPRMDHLMRETLARTGGAHHARDWPAVMRLAEQRPELARLVGIFRTDREGPDALIAFSLGCRQGGHAVYSDSASVRPDDMRISVAYPLLWDLITWAKREGASWFDMGGITLGTGTDGDPLGGISDFKRFFTEDLREVGEEWILPPHTWRARLAQFVHERRTGVR